MALANPLRNADEPEKPEVQKNTLTEVRQYYQQLVQYHQEQIKKHEQAAAKAAQNLEQVESVLAPFLTQMEMEHTEVVEPISPAIANENGSINATVTILAEESQPPAQADSVKCAPTAKTIEKDSETKSKDISTKGKSPTSKNQSVKHLSFSKQLPYKQELEQKFSSLIELVAHALQANDLKVLSAQDVLKYYYPDYPEWDQVASRRAYSAISGTLSGNSQKNRGWENTAPGKYTWVGIK